MKRRSGVGLDVDRRSWTSIEQLDVDVDLALSWTSISGVELDVELSWTWTSTLALSWT